MEISPRISRCGNHFLIITLFGLFSIGTSYFHKTLWGICPNASTKAVWTCSCNVDILTVDPNANKITPCGDPSINCSMSYHQDTFEYSFIYVCMEFFLKHKNSINVRIYFSVHDNMIKSNCIWVYPHAV